MKKIHRILAVLFCIGLIGCATTDPNAFQKFTGEVGLFGTSYNPSIPVYGGVVPQNYTYKDLGPVSNKCTNWVNMGNAASLINKSVEDMANKAKAMNANAVVKANIDWTKCSCNGEAVIFDVMPDSNGMSQSNSTPQSNEAINTQSGDELTTKLKTLKKLLSDGLITEQEFNERKQKLLDKYTNK